MSLFHSFIYAHNKYTKAEEERKKNTLPLPCIIVNASERVTGAYS